AVTFGAVFQHQRSGEVRLPLLLVVEDAAPLTQRVRASLLASPHLDVTEVDRPTARRLLDERRGRVAVVLPAGFGGLSALATAGSRPRVEILHHPASALESRWAEGVLTEVVLREAAADLLAPLGLRPPVGGGGLPFAVERSAVPEAGAVSEQAYTHS